MKICEHFMNQFENKNPGHHNDWTPFHEAAKFGQLEVCKLFVEKIEETNPRTIDGVTVLHAAAYGGHSDVYEFLMEKFEEKNPSSIDGCTPLHTAAANGSLEICEMILKNIQDIRGVLVEWNGKTPLALASDNEHIICMLLINYHMQSLISKDLGYYQESVPLYFVPFYY